MGRFSFISITYFQKSHGDYRRVGNDKNKFGIFNIVSGTKVRYLG